MIRKQTKPKLIALLVCVTCLGLAAAWLTSKPEKEVVAAGMPDADFVYEFAAIVPIPLEIKLDARRVALGEKLFNDKRFSRDNTIACATCHDLCLGGADDRVSAIGMQGLSGNTNTPTVFNSGFNFRQFWDGHAATLEDQVNGPTHEQKEMGSSWEEILGKLRQVPLYENEFHAIYPDGIEAQNVRNAIATYERSLITPNSRFDQYLRGNEQALTAEEKDGYRMFREYGCISCHQGINMGGNLFQRLGVISEMLEPAPNAGHEDTNQPTEAGEQGVDLGKKKLKVPSLRNVALTKPYLHNGSIERLEDTVEFVAFAQLGRQLSSQEVERIVKFLHTLTGTYQGRQL